MSTGEFNSAPNRRTFSWRSHLTSISLLVCLVVFLVPSGMAELATQAETDNVCQNWLTQMVHQSGDWAGETSPGVIEKGEFFSGDTLIGYYYNIAPQGFVLVPILKEMRAVRAYSDQGYFDPTEQDGFVQLMREVLADRLHLFEAHYGSLEATQPETGEVLFDRVQRTDWERLAVPVREFRVDQALESMAEKGPLTTTTWHQGAPYNDYCPIGDGGRCVVGCTATAASQILAYWQWPPHGLGSHTYTWEGDNSCGGSTPSQELTADFSDDYDWANIVDNCDGGCTAAQQTALAELCSEVGIAFDMDYGFCGSGAWPILGVSIYPEHFGYSPEVKGWYRIDHTLEEWFGMIQAEIDADRVVSYQINSHAIVCDGWRDQGSGWYEYHMNYGWGGSSNAWYVVDYLYCPWITGEVCPYEEELMLTHIYPQMEPIMSLTGTSVDDSAGDGDGHADVGETVSLSATVYNSGYGATGTSGVLTTSDSYVTVTVGTADFDGSIEWGAEGNTQTPFEFEVDPSCPDPHIVTFDLEVSCDGGATASESFYVFVGDTKGFEDDMEAGQGFWTHATQTNTYVDEWHLSTFRKYSGSSSWKAGGVGSANYADMSDGGLITPPFLLPGNPELSFWHWMEAETDWDGGVVYIAPVGGDWVAITPEGGYPNSIIDNPVSPFAPETPCYSGSFGWTQAVFDLSAYSGLVQIMFRFGSDGYVNEEGWYVDDVQVYSLGCCGIFTGGFTGNTNCSDDGDITLSDISRLIDNLYISKAELCCPENGNANGDTEGDITLADISRLIDHVFISKLPTASCP